MVAASPLRTTIVQTHVVKIDFIVAVPEDADRREGLDEVLLAERCFRHTVYLRAVERRSRTLMSFGGWLWLWVLPGWIWFDVIWDGRHGWCAGGWELIPKTLG
eukprot:365475-Chlamydomonas_euryale.AAC.5